VTLIETFAYMTDQLLYRLNRVPDRLYLRFLDLIGLHLLPATPARVPVTFWLSAPASAPLTIATGTNAATPRTETDASIVFATLEDLDVVPCSLHTLRMRTVSDDESVGRIEQLRLGSPVSAFSESPEVGDTLLVGLSDPVPRCAVRLQFTCHIDGVGVDPTRPPLLWEAWDGSDWVPCKVVTDETGGLNRDGGVVVLVPPTHEACVIDGERAGWLRARLVEVQDDEPTYTSSPIIHDLVASTVGGTIDAIHAEIIEDEELGVTEGVPGQRFQVSRTPVLAGVGAPALELGTDDGWQTWTQVAHFAESGPNDLHFVLDHFLGEVQFGPAVREPNGSLRQYGAVPPKGCLVLLRKYTTGGGLDGNVARGAIQTLKSSIPFVAGVENTEPAHGGVEAETIDQAKARGPILLRTRSRAVTAEDYEEITREAAPELARVKCVTAGEDGVEAGSVRVLVVPSCPSVGGRIDLADLVPAPSTLQHVTDRLDEVRLIGARVVVQPPLYLGLTAVARLIARPRVSVERVREDALTALYSFINPISGGPDGNGWPFGRPVQTGDVFGVLQKVRGVELVEDVRLFAANPVTGERGQETRRLDLEPTSLVFSYEHQVRVEQH
jgi:predicted phage baseplate assembly protein